MTAAGQSAVLAATVTEPAGSAVLVQAIYAEDYRDRTVTFRGQLRTTGVAGQAGLHLAAGRPVDPPAEHLRDRGGSSLYVRDPDGRSVELATPGIWPNY